MSHIQGHVDDTNTNQPTTAINRLTTRRSLKPEELAEMQKQKGHPPIGVARLDFSPDEKTRLIPFLNPERIELPSIGASEPIGFHIYLNNPDGNKYRAYAADVALWGDHEQAEERAVSLLKKRLDGGDLLEDYTPEQIESVIGEKEFSDKPSLRRVLQLTANYMRSFSYKILYFENNIQLKDDPSDENKKRMVERNIIDKVIFTIK